MDSGKWWVVGMTFFVVLLVSFTNNLPTDYPYFVQPKGWAPPQYNLSKNRQTEAGFKLGQKTVL